MLLPFRGEKWAAYREQPGQFDIFREKLSPDAHGNDPKTLAGRANRARPSDAGDCRVFFRVSEERLQEKRKGELQGRTLRSATLLIGGCWGPKSRASGSACCIRDSPVSRGLHYTFLPVDLGGQNGGAELVGNFVLWILLERVPDPDTSIISAVHTALCASVWRGCSSDCTRYSTCSLLC